MQSARSSIVVTGAEGQLGSELLRQLGSRGVGLTREQFDLADSAELERVLAAHDPEVIINTAAYTTVDRAEQEADLCRAINADAVATLARYCRQSGSLLVQLSTDYVFGADAARMVPYDETDVPSPVNVYGQTKLLGEQHAATCRHLIVRTCGLYGRRTKPTQRNFVDTMLSVGRERDRLRVVNDQHCTPSYVPHVARSTLELIACGATGIVHVVNEGSTTWHEFACEIFRQSDMPVTVEAISTAEYGLPAARPAYSVLSTGRFQQLTGHGLPTWQAALAEYLASLREPPLNETP